MLERQRFEEFSLRFQQIEHDFIDFFNKQTVEFRASRIEFPLFVDERKHGQAVISAHVIVVLSERGGDMHHARAVGQGNVRIANDLVNALPTVFRRLQIGLRI